MAAKRVVVKLPEELYEMLELACTIRQRSRSEIIQEALLTYFGESSYKPTEEEQAALMTAWNTAQAEPASLCDWVEVRENL